MIKIVADTTSCLAPENAQRLGVAYIPQIIVFGDDSYRDDTEMDAATFMKRLRASADLPKTAAPPPALYTPVFEEFSARGDTIIVLAPSAKVSGTYRSASVASQDFPQADIRVIDTGIIAGGLGALVIQAQRWASEGLDAETLIARVNEMCQRHRVYFMVSTLEYLHKGGRIGTAKALFGSLLEMKPILTLGQDGQIAPFENQRTHKRALTRLKQIALDDCPRDPSAFLCMMHGDAEEEARSMAAELGTALGIPVQSIPIYDLPPAILVHAGPGVLAVSYYTQPGRPG